MTRKVVEEEVARAELEARLGFCSDPTLATVLLVSQARPSHGSTTESGGGTSESGGVKRDA